MGKLRLTDVTAYIEENIKTFHKSRIAKIRDLSLSKILKGKNPYLFKAKDTKNADELIRSILDAFLSSGEETMFGNFLEDLAIFINGQVYGGRKSGIPGMDLEFEKEGTYYLVSIKSGPVWGNARAIQGMVQNFNAAKRTLLTSGGYKGKKIEFVNGCCYGIDDNPLKPQGYFKLCGQRFWAFISGEETLYEDLITPLGHGANRWNEEISHVYKTTYLRLLDELQAAGLTLPDESIDWRKLVQMTSKIRKKGHQPH